MKQEPIEELTSSGLERKMLSNKLTSQIINTNRPIDSMDSGKHTADLRRNHTNEQDNMNSSNKEVELMKTGISTTHIKINRNNKSNQNVTTEVLDNNSNIRVVGTQGIAT